MKKLQINIALCIVFSLAGLNVSGQKYFTKTGEISFFSHTPIEDIEAKSYTATTVYDSESRKIQWAVLIKSFEFEKALMQEHFNENYMESSKFPKAIFKGELAEKDYLDLNKDGKYSVDIKGDLTIHGVTNFIESKAIFIVEDGFITAESSLKVLVADYDIEIPSVVKENIAKEIEISIKANYELFEKP